MFTTNNCRFSRARNVITQQSRPHPTSDRERRDLTLILGTRLVVCSKTMGLLRDWPGVGPVIFPTVMLTNSLTLPTTCLTAR